MEQLGEELRTLVCQDFGPDKVTAVADPYGGDVVKYPYKDCSVLGNQCASYHISDNRRVYGPSTPLAGGPQLHVFEITSSARGLATYDLLA